MNHTFRFKTSISRLTTRLTWSSRHLISQSHVIIARSMLISIFSSWGLVLVHVHLSSDFKSLELAGRGQGIQGLYPRFAWVFTELCHRLRFLSNSRTQIQDSSILDFRQHCHCPYSSMCTCCASAPPPSFGRLVRIWSVAKTGSHPGW